MLWKVRVRLIKWIIGDRPVIANCRINGSIDLHGSHAIVYGCHITMPDPVGIRSTGG